ncbi:hypothetical protein BDZ94DRAFT_1266262, partial [Collybia nuda]
MDMPIANLPPNPPSAPFHPQSQQQQPTDPNGLPLPVDPQHPDSSSVPQKRKPGRPKGSTKKNTLGVESASPKIKRPVGRPRKDGFPAGSVSAPRVRASKPRSQIPVSHPSFFDPSMSGVGYPPMGYAASISVGPSSVPFALDPNLEADDWAVQARTKPNAFLTTLLSALAAPNPVSSAGPTVEEAFRSHLGSLSPNPSQMQPIPSLYSILKTFWLPSSPAYFSLTASASTARTPSEHRFLYWDPQPLVFNGISCPSCSAPLLNKGRISSGPIKIYDIDKPFFIIGCEYVCRSPSCTTATSAEGRKFASTDSSILRSLPIRLKDEFPARLMYGDTDAGSGPNIWNWKALGVSFALWNLVRGCLRAGLRREAILGLVGAVQHGVPEYDEHPTGPGPSGEEEDDDEDEGEDPMVGDTGVDKIIPSSEASQDPAVVGAAANGSDAASADLQNNTFVKKFLDAYNDAWKANSGAAEQGAAAAQAQAQAQAQGQGQVGVGGQVQSHQPSQEPTPSSSGLAQSHPQASTSVTPTPPQQAFEFGKAFPSTPFQYATAAYAFFPPAAPTPTSAPASGSPSATTATTTTTTTSKRAYPFEGEGGEGGETPAKRSPRHCCKCGSQECKGKGGRSFCTNGCQDCGKLECKGRNSRRPDKKCSEGWL